MFNVQIVDNIQGVQSVYNVYSVQKVQRVQNTQSVQNAQVSKMSHCPKQTMIFWESLKAPFRTNWPVRGSLHTNWSEMNK